MIFNHHLMYSQQYLYSSFADRSLSADRRVISSSVSNFLKSTIVAIDGRSDVDRRRLGTLRDIKMQRLRRGPRESGGSTGTPFNVGGCQSASSRRWLVIWIGDFRGLVWCFWCRFEVDWDSLRVGFRIRFSINGRRNRTISGL